MSGRIGVVRERDFKQARAKATYEALLQAATEIFVEKGFEAAQTPEIAARAGVPTGAFYRYFTDKREAFLEIARHHLASAHEDVMSEINARASTAKGAEDGVALVVDLIFSHAKRHRDLERVFSAMAYVDPDVELLRREFRDLRIQHLSMIVAGVVPTTRVPNPTAAAHVIQTAAMALASDCKGIGPDVKEGDVKHALVEMITRYLFRE